MITRTIEMHDVKVVTMVNGNPMPYLYIGFVGDISKPNKVLKKLQANDASIIAVTGFSGAYKKRYAMDEGLFIKMATCLDD